MYESVAAAAAAAHLRNPYERNYINCCAERKTIDVEYGAIAAGLRAVAVETGSHNTMSARVKHWKHRHTDSLARACVCASTDMRDF